MIYNLLIANIVATSIMLGVILFVQLVHYPLFKSVGELQFIEYHKRHGFWTTWVVGPPMLIEAFATILIILVAPPGINPQLLIWSGLCLSAVWLSTAIFQIPDHNTLSKGFKQLAHRRLVYLNWIRTFAWFAKTIMAILMLYQYLKILGLK